MIVPKVAKKVAGVAAARMVRGVAGVVLGAVEELGVVEEEGQGPLRKRDPVPRTPRVKSKNPSLTKMPVGFVGRMTIGRMTAQMPEPAIRGAGAREGTGVATPCAGTP